MLGGRLASFWQVGSPQAPSGHVPPGTKTTIYLPDYPSSSPTSKNLLGATVLEKKVQFELRARFGGKLRVWAGLLLLQL